MSSVRWRKIALIGAFLIFLGVTADAQYNYRGREKKLYYWGLTLAANYGNYNMQLSERFRTESRYSNIRSLARAGISIHVINNFRIHENLDFRVLPGVAFANRIIELTPANGDQVEQLEIQPVYFELPMLFRYKANAYKDVRVFVLGGLKYTYDIQTNSRKEDNETLNVSANDFALEFGVGAQFFFKYITFTPEIKFSQGLTNTVINSDRTETSSFIDRILSQVLTISIHFEG